MTKEEKAANEMLDQAISKLQERRAKTTWASDARILKLAIADLESLRISK